jgi:hypothetical protein
MENFKRLLESATERPWIQSGSHVYAAGEKGVYAAGEKGANICAISEPRATRTVGYTELGYGGPDIREAYANARLLCLGANHVGELVGILGIALDSLEPGKYNAKLIKRGRKLLAAIESEASRG